MSFVKQQVLPLSLPQEKNFANFLVGANRALITLLQEIKPDTALYLWGKHGSGCTHLLQASCVAFKKQNHHVLYLDLQDIDSLAFLFAGALDGVELLALDHVDAWVGCQAREEQLFHLFNRALQTPFAILWSAAVAPQNLPCVLNDFKSRLASLLIFHVQPLHDAELRRALQQHAKQRGFVLKQELAQFMLNHYPRNLSVLLDLLDKMDRASLQQKKPLTISLLKQLA
jgi:DnaA-homolog protein